MQQGYRPGQAGARLLDRGRLGHERQAACPALVREIAVLGGDIAQFVPPQVEAAFRRKLGSSRAE